MSNYWQNIGMLLYFLLVLALFCIWVLSILFASYVALGIHFHPLARTVSAIYAILAFVLGLALAGTLIHGANA